MHLSILSYFSTPSHPSVHTQSFQHITGPSALLQARISPTLLITVTVECEKVAGPLPEKILYLASITKCYRLARAKNGWIFVLYLQVNFPPIHGNWIRDFKLEYISALQINKKLSINFTWTFSSHPSSLSSSLIFTSSFCQHRIWPTHPNNSIRFPREYMNYQRAQGLAFVFVPPSISIH